MIKYKLRAKFERVIIKMYEICMWNKQTLSFVSLWDILIYQSGNHVLK